MNKSIILLTLCLVACSPPPADVVKAIAETCAKQSMVARLDGNTGSVYCVKAEQ